MDIPERTTDKPRIAFFMSAYNHENYVAEAMDSILHQTYPHWELFVADDGSSDRTPEIISSYKDERIHFFPLKENTRFAGAVEMLYDMIQPLDFDFIHGMASDDKLDPRKLEKQVSFFQAHPEYAACFTWDKVIFEEGAASFPEDYSHLPNLSRYAWMRYFYQHGNCFNPNSALIRKDVFYELDTINERYSMLGDYRLWFMIAAKYPIYLLQEDLTHYRRHDSNASNAAWEKMLQSAIENGRIMQDVFRLMSKDDFRRAFYPFLAHKDCSSEEAYLAEQFIVLANGKSPGRRQTAIDLYFDHSSNRSFTSLLKDIYGVDNAEFAYMKGNMALAGSINDILIKNGKPPCIPQKEIHTYLPWKVLVQESEAGRLDPNSLSRYTWACLQSMQAEIDRSRGTDGLFASLKNLLQILRQKLRDSQTHRHVLFIISAFSEWRPNADNIPFSADETVSFYLAFVNPSDAALAKDIAALTEESFGMDLPEIRMLDLIDSENACLRFADTVLPELTDLCYVDCLRPDYECFDMVSGYALSCSQYSIMRKQDYDIMQESEPQVLQLMDQVYYYDTASD